MLDVHGQDNGVLFIKARHMQAAQAKWERLSATNLAHITEQSQLVARVSERYSLPREQAERDVAIWVSDTEF
jgi:hypothetical protein